MSKSVTIQDLAKQAAFTLLHSKPISGAGRGQGDPLPEARKPDTASVPPLIDRKLIKAELLKFGVSLITPAEIALHLTGPEIKRINDLLDKVIVGVRGAE